MTKECIYCREREGSVTFTGREHVIPQAFGLFDGNNLVLRCVCDDCNAHFSRELDLPLARDSAEAFDRVSLGLTAAGEFKSLGKRSASYVRLEEGPAAGGRGYATANRDGGKELGVIASPQVWFSESEDGPWDQFLLPEVPSNDELIARGYRRGETVFVKTFEVADPLRLLEAKGFRVTGEPTEIPQTKGLVRVENVTQVSEPIFRAVTKIALNYVAAVLGFDVALASEFDAGRTFALHGSECARVRVVPRQNTWFRGRKGHYVSLTVNEGEVIAQLSILMRTQYFVFLGPAPSAPVRITSTAHLFDLETRSLREIEPLPIRPGPPLWPSSRRRESQRPPVGVRGFRA